MVVVCGCCVLLREAVVWLYDFDCWNKKSVHAASASCRKSLGLSCCSHCFRDLCCDNLVLQLKIEFMSPTTNTVYTGSTAARHSLRSEAVLLSSVLNDNLWKFETIFSPC